MLTSLALIFLVGLTMGSVCQRLKIPRIIGMLATGVVLGPFAANALDASILGVSGDLREMALIIILLKAGLSLRVEDLKKVGRPAILMSFLPATFEIAACAVFAPVFLGVTMIEGALIGAVLGAVSPAVVVPKMVQLMEERYGTDKRIPQLILAGASLDDVYAIVLFTSFLAIAQGGGVSLLRILDVPASIVLGIVAGAGVGFLLSGFFETQFIRKHTVRNSVKTIVILGCAFLLAALEAKVEAYVAFSGLLAVMSMACVIRMRSTPPVSERLSEKFGKLWIAAEVILFVLVGAAVDVRYTLEAGVGAILLIFVALIVRSCGVLLCLLGTDLSWKERLFCVIAYIPKATVQAAIGSVPLSVGLPCGNLVLSVAVLSIVLTAPLGAFGMDLTYRRCLRQETDPLPAAEAE